MEAKQRLKQLLKEKVIYSDGQRPDELAARVRCLKNVKGFFENDLKKQDRQTDGPILAFEMEFYLFLGVHPLII